LNSEFVAELGADVKGIYALEYWLFAGTGSERERPPLEAPASARARELVRLYAEDIDARASRVRQTLEKDARRLSESLAERVNEAFGRIWTMLLENIEALLIARFKLALWLASLDKLRASDIEGGPSRASHELALALLLATQRLYRGPTGCGFGDLVRSAAPSVHQHIETVFGRSVSLVQSLPPIDDAARSFRAQLEATIAALKELETAFRNEVPAALGVTLSFSSIDSD
jgi:predicted lipoprotein